MRYRQFNPFIFQQPILSIQFIKFKIPLGDNTQWNTVNSIHLFSNNQYRKFNLSNLTVNSIRLYSNNRFLHFNLSNLTVNSIRLFSNNWYRQFYQSIFQQPISSIQFIKFKITLRDNTKWDTVNSIFLFSNNRNRRFNLLNLTSH
jgi:hypothetical protein